MKTHSDNFKNEVRLFGRQLDSKLTYTIDEEEIELGVKELNSITPHYKGSILKSVMKQLDIDSNVEIPEGTEVNYQFGVKVGNSYEYLDFGNYIVYKVEKKEDTKSWEITCYDKMLYSMVDYENMVIEYPITIRDYLTTICDYLGLTFANENDEFANYDKEIQSELYLDKDGNSLDYTFRDVLDELAEVTASTICINNDDELEIRYLRDTGSSLLPKAYQEVEYIENRSSNYINTLYKPNNNTEIIVDAVFPNYMSYMHLFGSTYSANMQIIDNYGIQIGAETYPLHIYYGTSSYTPLDVKYKGDSSFYNERNIFRLAKNKFYINDELVNTFEDITFTSTYDLPLFAQNSNGTVQAHARRAKVYSCKIYDDGVLVRDFVPCYRKSDDKTGMYDLVNDVFYANLGNTEFLLGDEIGGGNDTINEHYLKDINVNFGEKYGPINSVVISRASESDSVYLRDEDSVETNGLTEIKIKDNQILNFNDRSDYLEDILEQLDGLEYYVNDFSSTGITYYDLCDKYNIVIDNNTYNCVMLNDEINITQGLEENIHTEELEKSETDYTKADKTDRRVNQTWIIANKQEGTITALTSRTEVLEEEMGNRYTKEQVNELVQTAETGLTNTFSEAGGNNIFRNTGLWFTKNNSFDEYEFWEGNAVRQKNDKAINMNAIGLLNNTFSQEQVVPNGSYVVSFKYKKLIALSSPKVIINDIEYSLDEIDDTEFVEVIEVSSQHINVSFTTDIDNSCEVYDLMVNVGRTKLAYSQNQNETTTDTVNISKGITITSSDTDTVFKANADGIRTLDKSGNELTRFTDTGMTTKKMIVEDTSQIVGTIWQEVGSQTWITRM